MAVGNNTGLSIIVWLWVSFSHTHTHKKKLLVLAWGVNVNVFNIPIKNSLFCRFFADVERCTHAVHLFCVWAYVLLHCVVVDNHSNCYIHQQWSHPQDASRYCCRFDIYDLILLSAERYYLHMKKKVHTHTHRETEWACDLWETRLIFGRIFHTSHFPLTECRAHLSGRKSRLTALYHTTWQALINFQKWSRVRSQRQSLKNMHPYGVII